MAKQIILMRHGKSDWQAPHEHDHDRPLAKRGKKAAKTMGWFLTQAHWVPDQICSSTARRAQETAERALRAGGWDCPMTATEAFYAAEPEDVIAVIRQMPESSGRCLLIGHEPTWSELVQWAIGSSQIHFVTGSMACLEFNTNTWQAIRAGQGQLLWFLPPRLLTDGPLAEHFK